MTGERNPTSRQHRRVAVACAVFVCSMVGASFAAVPLYDMFCRVTGYGGTPRVAEAHAERKVDRTIRVRFDANVSPGLNWEFAPVQREMEVQIGRTYLAFYRAKNRGREGAWGTASYNVTPELTGGYFNKMHCFCFEKQHLAAGEEIDMPVQFYVDPALADDPELDRVNTITLSYTFFTTQAPPSVAQTVSGPKL